jgi:hypothetical protein
MLATVDKRPSNLPVIGMDLDDMIADYTASSLAVIQKAFGPDENVCREKHFDYLVEVSFGADAGRVVSEAMKYPGFWLSIPPHLGVVKSLMDLMRNHSIHIVTSRPAEFYDVTKYWLCLYEIPFDNLTLVTSRAEKLDVARAAQCVAFVDDNQETAETMRDAGLVAGQLAWPWNTGGDGIIRANDWPSLSLLLAQEIKLKLSNFRLF